MKISSDSKTALKTIQDAKGVGLLVQKDVGVDPAAAMMALYHLFFSMGKKVTPVVPEKIPQEVQGLASSLEIKHDFGPKNLVITLDTNKTPIERVSYKSEGEKFQLVIHPLARSFEVENIHYSYEGLGFDLLVTLGVQKLSDLGELYEKSRGDFSKAVVINLDVSSANENYGQINIVDPSKSSISELVFHQLLAWELTPSKEVAQCLLTGLAANHSSLQSSLQPIEIPVEKRGVTNSFVT